MQGKPCNIYVQIEGKPLQILHVFPEDIAEKPLNLHCKTQLSFYVVKILTTLPVT